jgi:hypothetical protein
MPDKDLPDKPTINDLFPEGTKVLLTGGGKEFIERIGVEAARLVVLNIMMGENIRTQTEPLTRQRIAHISGALVTLFARGHLEIEGFTSSLSEIAVRQIQISRKNDNASIWPAQWLLGLTGKSVQNVLRSDPELMREYVRDFEGAIQEASEKCRLDMGNLTMTLGFTENPDGSRVELDWRDIIRLTTAIGSQTLTIRGSDKSIYGKLFERLVLGSVLTVLGFERVRPDTNTRTNKVFWLSDSSDLRESDATLLVAPGKLARFDIGFIGPGNPEISRDKLSRYARELETAGGKHSSVTFIVVDRLPITSKTRDAAFRIGAELIQMSMQYWPQELARRLGQRLDLKHELQTMPQGEIRDYLSARLETIPIQDFLSDVSLVELEKDSELPEVKDEIEWVEDEE